MTEETFVVAPEQAGQRLDKLLSESLEGLTRSAVQKLMEEGAVLCEDRPVAKNAKAKAGETVTVQIPDPVNLAAVPQNIPVEIVYEDDDLLVVNKPKGMVVHPAPGNPDGTLVNALLYHCEGRLSSINGIVRPGIVHRIDKDTSGLLIVAKTISPTTRWRSRSAPTASSGNTAPWWWGRCRRRAARSRRPWGAALTTAKNRR